MLETTIINVIFLTNVEKWPIFGLSQLLALHFFGFTSTISRFGKRFRVASTV